MTPADAPYKLKQGIKPRAIAFADGARLALFQKQQGRSALEVLKEAKAEEAAQRINGG